MRKGRSNERPLSRVHIAHPARGEEKGCERERVAVDEPGRLGRGELEVEGDGRDGDDGCRGEVDVEELLESKWSATETDKRTSSRLERVQGAPGQG